VRLMKRLRKHDRELLASQPLCQTQVRDYPIGWYFARFSEDLKPGQVVPVEFMSHQFALFRGESGAVAMIDSQCCHMGADLSRCGSVSGDELTCGYHAWAFGLDGRCRRVPQTDRIPSTARQHVVPTTERAGNIWFWYGPNPPTPLRNIERFESPDFMNIRGEVNVGRSHPLPIIEHIADISHFPHNHKAAGALEYQIGRNSGDTFEFQLRPATGGSSGNIQRIFKPFAFVEMIAPCSGLYRTQRSEGIDRKTPRLTMILGATPIREDLTIFSWRIAVYKFRPRFLMWPINKILGFVMWATIYRNNHKDLQVLKWMRPASKTLWVRPDGSSVREFRAFYRRNILPGWRFEHAWTGNDQTEPSAQECSLALDHSDSVMREKNARLVTMGGYSIDQESQ
jgi:phenylpropionate dioxygenase-like ring-hydroxylating dioxygenase large terminal subunit